MNPTLMAPEQELKDRLLHGRPTLEGVPVRGALTASPLFTRWKRIYGALLILGPETVNWLPGRTLFYSGPVLCNGEVSRFRNFTVNVLEREGDVLKVYASTSVIV